MLLGPNISQLPHAIINPAALYSSFCLFFFPYQFSAILSLPFLFIPCHVPSVYTHTTLAFAFPTNKNLIFFQANVFIFFSCMTVAL